MLSERTIFQETNLEFSRESVDFIDRDQDVFEATTPTESEPSPEPQEETPSSYEEQMRDVVAAEMGVPSEELEVGEFCSEAYFDGTELFRADKSFSLTKEAEELAEKSGTTQWLEEHHIFLSHLQNRPGEVFVFGIHPTETDEGTVHHMSVAMGLENGKVFYREYEFLEKKKEFVEELESESLFLEEEIDETLLEEGEKALEEELAEIIAPQVQEEAQERVFVEEEPQETELIEIPAEETVQVLSNEAESIEPQTLTEPSLEGVPQSETQETLETIEVIQAEFEEPEVTVSSTEPEEVIEAVPTPEPAAAVGIRLVEVRPEEVAKEESVISLEEIAAEAPSVPAQGLAIKEAGKQGELTNLISEAQVEITNIEIAAPFHDAAEPEKETLLAEEPKETAQEVVDKAREVLKEEIAANDNERVVSEVADKEEVASEKQSAEAEDPITRVLQELFAEDRSSLSKEILHGERATEVTLTENEPSERESATGVSPELAFMIRVAPSSQADTATPANDTTDVQRGPTRNRNGITLVAA